MIFDIHANLKYKYGNNHFCCGVYQVDTVGRNQSAIKEYIKNQLEEDIVNDQISLKEYIDPFMGNQSKQAKKQLLLLATKKYQFDCQTIYRFTIRKSNYRT